MLNRLGSKQEKGPGKWAIYGNEISKIWVITSGYGNGYGKFLNFYTSNTFKL